MGNQLRGVLRRRSTTRHFTIEHAKGIRLHAPAAIVTEVSNAALEEGDEHREIGRAVGSGS